MHSFERSLRDKPGHRITIRTAPEILNNNWPFANPGLYLTINRYSRVEFGYSPEKRYFFANFEGY